MAQLNFTILQHNTVWQDVATNLSILSTKINEVPSTTHIVLLPEMFATGFTMDTNFAENTDGQIISWMAATAKAKKIIIGGSVLVQENGQFYNRFIWMQPNGVHHSYNKRHLFSLANEHKVFTPGTEKIIVQANGIKICLQVCYDLRFPVFVRQQKNNWYDAIIYVANWPEKRITAWQNLLAARAIENQCYTIGVNRVGQDGNDWQYTGSSMVVDPLGKVLHQLPNQEMNVTFSIDTTTITEVRTAIPFLQDADDFTIL
jgi:omega-amidase